MTEPASNTLAYLRRLDEKFDRVHGEVGELRIEVGGLRSEVAERLGRIEDELLVLNGIILWLEGRDVDTTGGEGDPPSPRSAGLPKGGVASPSWKRPARGERGPPCKRTSRTSERQHQSYLRSR
jgi:hypothetical protein